MIALLQRVSNAEVVVSDRTIAAISTGLLVLVGVERRDQEGQADRLLERLLGYRVFPDAEGRMNRSLVDVGGGLLLVSQFTLAADTSKGTRPGFSPLRPPTKGAGCSTTWSGGHERLTLWSKQGSSVRTCWFGRRMTVPSPFGYMYRPLNRDET